MLSIFIGILMVVMVIVSILLVFIVLMQRPKQEGLGAAFGGGMMDSVAGAHTSDVLQKGTIWLATIFMGSAILVSILQAKKLQADDVGEVLPEQVSEPILPPLPPSMDDLPPSIFPPSDPGSTPAPAVNDESPATTPPKEDDGGADADAPATEAPEGDSTEGEAPATEDAAPSSADETDGSASDDGKPEEEEEAP